MGLDPIRLAPGEKNRVRDWVGKISTIKIVQRSDNVDESSRISKWYKNRKNWDPRFLRSL